MAARFTSTDTLASARRHVVNPALHRAGLPTLGSARTVEAYISGQDFTEAGLRMVVRALRPVGLRVPRVHGSHA